MKKSYIVLMVIAGLIVLGGLGVWGEYNGLVSKQEMVKNKWADVQAQYQRRMDLIPNIVNSVKGSANFEQTTLTEVTSARSAWAQSTAKGDINGEVGAARSFDSAISRLLVTVEAYPDIKSTQAFLDLNTELEGSENRVSVARRDYNEAVNNYNVKTRQFPSNTIAGWFGFHEWAPFEADAGASKAPAVDFTK